MRVAFLERWRVYMVWLGSGVSGILPNELRLTLGPVRALLPLARQVAETLAPWLAALLEARQRAGLAFSNEWTVIQSDLEAWPLTRAQTRRVRASWAQWWLEAELRRLIRLAEAPEALMRRRGWLPWEVRYWALAVSLARIGQVYAALEQRQPEEAERLFKNALARVWRQALRAGQAA